MTYRVAVNGFGRIGRDDAAKHLKAGMASVLRRDFGVERGYLTTVHAYTNDRVGLNGPHKDPHRARSAAVNIIPTSTGAAKAVALRVPVENGSISDLTCELSTSVSAFDVNAAFAAAGRLTGVLRHTEAPVVSRDVLHDPVSCVFDAGLTQASGKMVKVFGWYDNDWGYTNRLVDPSVLLADKDAS